MANVEQQQQGCLVGISSVSVLNPETGAEVAATAKEITKKTSGEQMCGCGEIVSWA